MRSLALVSTSLVSIASLAACSSDPADMSTPPASVRDVLAGEGTSLAVASGSSTGAIVARLWRTGWEDDRIELAIGAGELAVSTNASGDIVVEELSFSLAPIALSDEVFAEPAALTDLHVELAADAPPAPTAWADANTATASTAISLRLSWSLQIGDDVTPLGPIVMASLPVELAVGGGPARVEASLALESTGTLWSWAHLIELADLSLAISATSSE
jgi:hypothetical protein